MKFIIVIIIILKIRFTNFEFFLSFLWPEKSLNVQILIRKIIIIIIIITIIIIIRFIIGFQVLKFLTFLWPENL